MTLATIDSPHLASPRKVPRPSFRPSIQPDPLPELTKEQWAAIQARLRATGVPPETGDDRVLARTMGVSGLVGIALTGLAACGFWALIA